MPARGALVSDLPRLGPERARLVPGWARTARPILATSALRTPCVDSLRPLRPSCGVDQADDRVVEAWRLAGPQHVQPIDRVTTAGGWASRSGPYIGSPSSAGRAGRAARLAPRPPPRLRAQPQALPDVVAPGVALLTHPLPFAEYRGCQAPLVFRVWGWDRWQGSLSWGLVCAVWQRGYCCAATGTR